MSNNTKPNGGPAFPVPSVTLPMPLRGMSLRQYYTGQAIVGLCAAGRTSGLTYKTIAKDALGLADAVIKEELNEQQTT